MWKLSDMLRERMPIRFHHTITLFTSVFFTSNSSHPLSTHPMSQNTKKVEHIVMLTMANLSEQQEKDFQNGAQEMRDNIPGIIELHFGRGTILAEDRQNGYTHCLRVLFENKDALEGYLPHEIHMKFKSMILKNLTGELIVMDWERED